MNIIGKIGVAWYAVVLVLLIITGIETGKDFTWYNLLVSIALVGYLVDGWAWYRMAKLNQAVQEAIRRTAQQNEAREIQFDIFHDIEENDNNQIEQEDREDK